jgi:pimeloyl-ACP methyl ester carboxylesterase
MPTVQTRYARSADVHVAYQAIGDGPVDLVLVNGWVTNVELMWEDPAWNAFFRRLASFSRLILFDKRGTGLSDRVSVREMPTLEERMDDVRAVMDAAGSSQAIVFGISEGGPMSVLFAASYPGRTQGLVLYGSFPRITSSEDYRWGFSPEQVEPLLELAERSWGDGTFSGNLIAPSELPGRLPYFARLEREGASPGAVIALIRMLTDIDVRAVLPSISVPTLIIHRDRDAIAPIEGARYMAGQIPGAQLVELEGEHSPLTGDTASVVDQIEEFVTGRRAEREPDRVLATVMFTDIVDSTVQAAALGDRQWTELLERHHQLVRQQLRRFGGQEIKTIGDGFLATSMVRPAEFAAHWLRSRRRERPASASGPGCTQASASAETEISAASPSTPGHASPRSQQPEKYSSREPSKTSSPAQAFDSRIAAPAR